MMHDNPESVEPDELKELLLLVAMCYGFATITRSKMALDYARVANAHQVVKRMVLTRVSAAHAQHVSCLLLCPG